MIFSVERIGKHTKRLLAIEGSDTIKSDMLGKDDQLIAALALIEAGISMIPVEYAQVIDPMDEPTMILRRLVEMEWDLGDSK